MPHEMLDEIIIKAGLSLFLLIGGANLIFIILGLVSGPRGDERAGKAE